MPEPHLDLSHRSKDRDLRLAGAELGARLGKLRMKVVGKPLLDLPPAGRHPVPVARSVAVVRVDKAFAMSNNQASLTRCINMSASGSRFCACACSCPSGCCSGSGRQRRKQDQASSGVDSVRSSSLSA
jgi:hypothetical protein